MSYLKCDKCSLGKIANYTCIQGMGSKDSRIMIVGDNPNFIEDREGEYGRGNSHKLLLELLQLAGIKLKDCYYTPAVKCRKPEKGKVSATELSTCKQYLIPELEEVNPDYIITLGATALKALTNKVGVREMHGQEIEHKQGYKLLVSFHPAMALRDPRFSESIRKDFIKFGKIIRGEELEKHKLTWEWVKSEKHANEVVEILMKSKVIAWDTETNGLEPRLKTSKLGLTVVANFRCSYVLDHEHLSKEYLSYFYTQLEFISKRKTIVAQNGKFDVLWAYYMYGVRIKISFDTMLAGHLLDENSPTGLKPRSVSLLGMDGYDVPLRIKQGKFRKDPKIADEERQQRAEYAAWDGYATIRLYRLYKDQLNEEPELENLFYKLVIPVARSYEQMEINGTWIDPEKMDEAERKLKLQVRGLLRKLNRLAKPHLLEEMNWNSGDQLNAVIFDGMGLIPSGFTEKGAPSTAEDNLIKMKDQHEIVPTLLEYRGKFKQLSSFIEGWRKRMVGGKIYPSFKVSGTVTGRPSCSNPNLQQVPRDPFIRSLVGAPEGWVFFEADYSQIELRVAACLSREPNMLRIFRDGGDIHESTYQLVMGVSTQEAVEHIKDPGERKAQLKEERKKAKAINFGFIYGMGWKKFMEYAENKMGLIITATEAKNWRTRYFDIYPELLTWHDRQRRVVRSLGEVRTLTGRVRRLPQINSPDRGLSSEAERLAVNSPVQGFAAELMLMAVVEVDDYFRNKSLKLQGTVHDAMVGRVKKDVALPAMARVKEIMESPRIMEEMNIELAVPIIADISLGNWGVAEDITDLPEPL